VKKNFQTREVKKNGKEKRGGGPFKQGLEKRGGYPWNAGWIEKSKRKVLKTPTTHLRACGNKKKAGTRNGERKTKTDKRDRLGSLKGLGRGASP